MSLGDWIEETSERLGWDYGVVADAVYNINGQTAIVEDEQLEAMIRKMCIAECSLEGDWESISSPLSSQDEE